jgi:molecular chaperone GrpE
MSKKSTNTNEKAKVEEKAKPEEKAEKGLEEKVAELLKENEELKASVAKEKDDYLRLMADFENFRRHSAEAKLELVSSASADTIKGLLPILDDCERAMKMLSEAKDDVALEGTELIYNKLMGYLKTKGLEPIKAKDEKFDTDFHEAVAQVPVPEEDRKGLVFDVVQTGYTLSGKVIRYAKVVVGI